jgi:hypothetical protein
MAAPNYIHSPYVGVPITQYTPPPYPFMPYVGVPIVREYYYLPRTVPRGKGFPIPLPLIVKPPPPRRKPRKRRRKRRVRGKGFPVSTPHIVRPPKRTVRRNLPPGV